MASGDVVNFVSALNTAIIYQPAATVEVCVTSLFANFPSMNWGITDGTNVAYCRPEVPGGLNFGNVKVMINNSNYLHINASSGYYNGFTGIQIK